MAQYHASIRGAGSTASRLGSKSSGLYASVKAWGGEVNVYLWHDEITGTDRARVSLADHGGGHAVSLYDGPVDAWDTYRRAGALARMALDAERAAVPVDADDIKKAAAELILHGQGLPYDGSK